MSVESADDITRAIFRLIDGFEHGPEHRHNMVSSYIQSLLRSVKAEEREECAKVAGEKSAIVPNQNDFVRGYANGRGDASQAIRSRSVQEHGQ